MKLLDTLTQDYDAAKASASNPRNRRPADLQSFIAKLEAWQADVRVQLRAVDQALREALPVPQGVQDLWEPLRLGRQQIQDLCDGLDALRARVRAETGY